MWQAKLHSNKATVMIDWYEQIIREEMKFL